MAKKVEVGQVEYLTPWQLRERQIRMRNYSPDCSECFQDGYQSRGIYKPEEVAIMYPVSPVTGNAIGDLTRIMSSVVSPREKEEIMSRLKKVDGSYMSVQGLSDSEILDLVPPRYIGQDPVDISHWRTYLSEHVFPEMKDVVNALNEPAPAPDKVDEPSIVE